MKKRIISVVIIMILVLGTYTVALADENSNATRNSLKSVGNVVYTDGENRVEIHSDDLYMLADKMDSFKECVADQLAQCHTYFLKGSKGTSTVSDSDIKVVHTQPSDSDAVDPVTLDFNTILEGIAASQSIPSDVTEYGYADGTALYKTESGELTTDGTLENVQQIDISAATPENLSAGSAAWVNGELILGTGADNNAYYNYASPQDLQFTFNLKTASYSNYVRTFKAYTVPSDCIVIIHAGGIRAKWSSKPSPSIKLTVNGTVVTAPSRFTVSDQVSENIDGTVYSIAESAVYLLSLNEGDVIGAKASDYNSFFVYGYIIK